MKEKDDNRLVYTDDNGNEVLCEILFTFHADEFDKNYVLFYPIGEEDEDGTINVRAAQYIEKEDDEEGIGELFEVTNDDEWAVIEEMLALYEENNVDEDDDEEETEKSK